MLYSTIFMFSTLAFGFLIVFIIWLNPNKKSKKKQKPTQLELYKQFGEEVLLDCGIPIENFFIKPHYENKYGICFRRNKINAEEYPMLCNNEAYKHHFSDKYTAKELTQSYTYSNVFNKEEVYIIVPEIVDQYTLYVWLHEIGHYIQHHYEGYKQKPSFVKEFEAEKYAQTLIQLCPIEEKKRYESVHYAKHLFNIDLQYAINCGRDYVQSHLEKANEDEKYFFLSPRIQKYLDTEVVLYKREEVE